nr:MAG TPA: hypothetical protein [Caudoviricetes sp.]
MSKHSLEHGLTATRSRKNRSIQLRLKLLNSI